MPIGTRKSISVTVTNTGNAAVDLSGEVIVATGYSFGGLTSPNSIGAGKSAVLTVTFAPTSTGLFSGYLLIMSNATNSSVKFGLSGTGVAAGKLAATPGSVSFGSVAVGAKNSQTVQLKNVGGDIVTITSASVAGAGFSISGITFPKTLAPAATANLTVAYAPTTSGSTSGSLALKNTTPSLISGNTLTVPLDGTGGSAVRALTLSSSTVNFGNETLGNTTTQAITVKNSGNSSVTISTVTVSGAGLSVSGGLSGATLTAGQSSTLNIAFTPKTTGTITGNISLTSNATNSPNNLPVTGTGISNTAHFVKLAWLSSATTGVIGYNVYRSTTAGGVYSKLSSAVITALSYSDGAVTSGATYYYVVTAVTMAGGESAYSGHVVATVP